MQTKAKQGANIFKMCILGPLAFVQMRKEGMEAVGGHVCGGPECILQVLADTAPTSFPKYSFRFPELGQLNAPYAKHWV